MKYVILLLFSYVHAQITTYVNTTVSEVDMSTSPTGQTTGLCPAGRFTTPSDCNICPAGQYQEESVKVECQDCPVGRYLLDAAQDATKHQREEQCLFCPKGREFNNTISSCKTCTAGRYQNSTVTASVSCQECPVGKYLPKTTVDNHDSLSDCIDCEIGKYQEQVAQGSCTICEAGKYQDQTAKNDCDMCQEGRYISDGLNSDKLQDLWITVERNVDNHDSPEDCKQCVAEASHDRTACKCLDGALENINPYDDDPKNFICACETEQNSLFCNYSKTQYCYNEDGDDHLRCENKANTKPVCDKRQHIVLGGDTFATWKNITCPSPGNPWQYKQHCNPENEINDKTCFCTENEMCSADQYCIISDTSATYCSKFPKCPDNSGRMSAKTDELGKIDECVCSFNNVCGKGRTPPQESCFTDGKCLKQRDCNSGGLAFQNEHFTSCRCKIPETSEVIICEGTNFCYDTNDITEQGCFTSAPEDCSYTDGYTPNNQNELCLCRKSSTNEAVWCNQGEPYCNNECDKDDDCSSLPPSCSATQNPTCRWINGDDGSGNTYTDTSCSCGGELCQKNQYCDVLKGDNEKCHNRFCKDYISGAQQNDLCQRDGYGNGLLEGNPQCSADICSPDVDYVTCCKECPPEQQAPFGKCRSMCMDSVCEVKTWTIYTTSEERCDDIHTKEECEHAAVLLNIEFNNVTSVDYPHGCSVDNKIMWNTNGSEYCNTSGTQCVCIQNKNTVENWVWKRPDPKLTTDVIQLKYAEYDGSCYGACTEESDILRCCIQSKKCEDQNVDDLGCAMEPKYTRELTKALCKNFDCTREECCESKECTCTGGTPSDFRDCPEEGDEHCASCNSTSYKENNKCSPITHCNSTEFEEKAPTSLSNRVCKVLAECGSEQWVSKIHTDTEDRVCSDWKVCVEGEYETSPGSLQEDRRCSAQNTCAYAEYLLVTNNNPVGTCTNLTTCGPEQWISKNHTTTENRECSDWDICQEEEYHKIPGSVYKNRECAVPTECAERIKSNYTMTSNRKCVDWTICNQNEYEKSAPDKISNTDRICEKNTVCTSSQYQKTAVTETEDTVCETVQICEHNLGEYEKTPPTDTTDRICDTCLDNNNLIPGCIGCMTSTDCNYDKKAKIHHGNTLLTGDTCSEKTCTFINVITDSTNDYMTFEPIIDNDNALIYGENYRFDIKTPGDNATFVGHGITFVKEREEVLSQVTFDNYVYFNIPPDNIFNITYYDTVQSGWKFSVKRNCQYTESLLRENSCTSECGGPGSEMWKRKITHEPFNGGTSCPEDLFVSKPCVNPTYKCPINCVYEENTNPNSTCDAECGKTGKKLTREIVIKVSPKWEGTVCPENEYEECYSSPPTGDCDCQGTKYDHCGVCSGKDLCKGCDRNFYSSTTTHKDYESEKNLYIGGTKPFVNNCGQCNPSIEENEKCLSNKKLLESSITKESQFQEKIAFAVLIVVFITFIVILFIYINRKQSRALPIFEPFISKKENKSDILYF